MLWKDPVVVEAVVLCCVCVLVAICCVVPVCCAVRCCPVTVAVGCCCCCRRVVVVGAEGRAGSVGCSSLLPRDVLGVVAAVTATTHPVANLDADVVVPLAAAVVASAARSCLEVVDTVAKAQACRWSNRSC